MLNEKIGFVFTNFNNADYTINAVKSLQNDIIEKRVKIVIVDNNSDQEDILKLKCFVNKYSDVEVIISKENVGYFRGLNIGIKYFRQNYFQINCLVVGNNDVLFPTNFYKSILKKKDIILKYPVVSPDIVTSDGFHQNPHVIEGISKTRELIYDLYHLNYNFARLIIKIARITNKYTRRKDEDNYEISREIYQGYGACYILTPKFFDLFEELYSPTFLMYEEYFLSRQLSEKGFKIFYEPSISITHLMHASTDKLPGKVKWKFSKQSHTEYRKYIKII